VLHPSRPWEYLGKFALSLTNNGARNIYQDSS